MKRFVFVLAALAIVVLVCGVVSARPRRARRPAKKVKTIASKTYRGPAPRCDANDPRVPVPGAPHGMYVWYPYKVQVANSKSSSRQTSLEKIRHCAA